MRACAVGALALFSYFRGIAPTEVPAALALSALAEAAARPGALRWRGVGNVLMAGAWLVFAYLFLRVGEGRSAFLSDAVKAALLVALLVGVGLGMARLWPAAGLSKLGMSARAAAVALMTAAALTLYWSFWPAMAGALGALVSEAALMAVAFIGMPKDSRLAHRCAWALSYLGQVAMAYAFLR